MSQCYKNLSADCVEKIDAIIERCGPDYDIIRFEIFDMPEYSDSILSKNIDEYLEYYRTNKLNHDEDDSTGNYSDEPTPFKKTSNNLNSNPNKHRNEHINYCRKEYGFYNPGLHFSVKEDKVTIKPNIRNYKLIIQNYYPNIRYSIFERTIFLGDEALTGSHVLQMLDKVVDVLKGLNVNKKELQQAIQLAAEERSFNPLKEWFEALPMPSNKGYLDTYLFDVCKVERTEINRIIGRKWLISAVARAIKPGSPVEGSLIFSGKQKCGKTFFFKIINPKPEYYCDANVDITNDQKSSQTYQGAFIIEFNELSGIGKKDLEMVKGYLTRDKDTYVPKFENLKVCVPRMYIFGGSSNKKDILDDPTGNRRLWCVHCPENFDRDMLIKIKTELWAEAYQAYMSNPNPESWFLSDEEVQMLAKSTERFESDNPLADHMRSRLNERDDEALSSDEIMTIAKRFDSKAHPKTMRVVMEDILGWTHGKFSSGPHKGNVCYKRPASNKIKKDKFDIEMENFDLN